MEGLTAGFGMGPGVSPPLLPPETCMFQAVIFAFFPALIFVRPRSTYFHTPSLDSLDKLAKTRKSLRLCIASCFDALFYHISLILGQILKSNPTILG